MRRGMAGLLVGVCLACACVVAPAPDADQAARGLPAIGSASPFGTFELRGPVPTDASGSGSAGLASDRPLDTASPSPSASDSTPSAAPPRATARSTPPSTSGPPSQPPTASPSPSPTSPVIISFTPSSGPPGTFVFIAGDRLTGITGVRFGGIDGSLAAVSATSVIAIVPFNAQSGPITVIAPTGSATSTTSYTVTAPPPTQPNRQTPLPSPF